MFLRNRNRINRSLYHQMGLGTSCIAACLIQIAMPMRSQQAQLRGPEEAPVSWVEAAVENEIPIIDNDGEFPLRYRLRKIDAKGDTTREIIESREGTVSRIVQRGGRALSEAEDQDERNRLNGILEDPSDFLKHRKRDNNARGYAMSLVKQMPQAMIYTYAPNQPQPPGNGPRQIVLDFHSNPEYHPPNTVSELLTGLEGRAWIDASSRHLTRIVGKVVKPVNLYGGMLAHIYPGGTVEFEQANVGQNRWVYSHLDEDLTIRELLLKTAVQKSRMSSWDYRLLPAPVSYQEAVRILLATPLPH